MRRREYAGLAGASLAWALSFSLLSSACTSILGVSDLPPATDGGDAASSDASGHDATNPDATREAASDAEGGATPDAGQKPPAFAVSPTALRFGDAGGLPGFVACGTTSTSSGQVTLTNNTGSPLSWSSSFGLGGQSPYSLSRVCTFATPCTFDAGDGGGPASEVVTVTGPPVPADAGVTTYDDTLTFFSSAPGDKGTAVALTTAAYGAVLQFSQTDVNFGSQPANQPDAGYAEPEPLLVENVGTGPFTGTLTVGTPPPPPDGGTSDAVAPPDGSAHEFDLTGVSPEGGALVVPAAGATPVTVVFNPNGHATPADGTLVLGPSSVAGLCSPLPPPVTLEAVGSSSPISVTASITFNNQTSDTTNGQGVACGTTATPVNVTVTNSGPTAAAVTKVTFALGIASPFSVPMDAVPVVIPPGTPSVPGSATISVVASAIPQTAVPGQGFSDIMTVTTNAVGDLPHVVPVKMTAAGVVLSISSTDIDVGTARINESVDGYVFVSNSGNVPVSGGRLMTTTGDPTFSLQAPDLNPFQSTQVNVRYQPAAVGPLSTSATLQLASNVPVCSPTTGSNPGFTGALSVTLSGNGVATQNIEVNPNQPLLHNATCSAPGQTPAPWVAEITIKNALQFPTSGWNATLAGPDAAFFVIGPTSGSDGVDEESVVTLTGLPLSSSSGLTANQVAYGLNAIVAIVADDGEEYIVPVHEQVQGAFLQWSQGSVTVPPPAGAAAFMLFDANPQNDAVALTLTGTGFLLATSAPTSMGLPRPYYGIVADNHANAGATGTVSVSLPSASAALCAPLPAPLPLTLGTP